MTLLAVLFLMALGVYAYYLVAWGARHFRRTEELDLSPLRAHEALREAMTRKDRS